MGMVLFLVGVFALVGLVITLSDSKDFWGIIPGTVIGALIAVVILGFCRLISYESSLDLGATFNATVNQYRDAIELYESKIVISEKAITDFTGKAYAGNVAGFIRDFRDEVIEYNKSLYKKNARRKSKWLNWLTWPAPEECVQIQLIHGD